MTLIFNLQGAVQEVNKAETNKETIEALNRLSEEFYKTIGILLFLKYQYYTNNGKISNFQQVGELIKNYFVRPTYDSWIKLGKICGDVLPESGDKFILNFKKNANQTLSENDAAVAKKILKEIHALLQHLNYNPPKRIRNIEFVEIMRLLRNFRSHEWDNNLLLQPLIDAGIKPFILKQITEIFYDINVEIIKPISIERKESIKTYSFKDSQTKICQISLNPDKIPILDETYVYFDDNETPFEIYTNLIHFDEKSNRVFVFSKMEDKGNTLYVNLPSIGEIKFLRRNFDSITDVFRISKESCQYSTQIDIFRQKYGLINEDNGIIHNVPEVISNYVNRPVVEIELLKKLSHRRNYITTLDGGGGFGKTELTKKVIWGIIKKEYSDEFLDILDFDIIVWISGKITFFSFGKIIEKEQSFKTLEDLLDCIIYLTNNVQISGVNFETKKGMVINILNNLNSVLIILDNLETVTQKDEVWNYLDILGDKITKNLKVLITSRVLGPYSAHQRLNIRSMEDDEAKQLIVNEFERLDLPQSYRKEKYIKDIMDLSGKIPLLIIYFIGLLQTGYNIFELKGNIPKGIEALNFICSFQWNELSKNSQKLLMGIAKNGGKLSYAQAKLLCNLTEMEFQESKEELQNRSFLIDQELINCILAILPPINKFIVTKIQEYPEIEDELDEGLKLINVTTSGEGSREVSSLLYTDEIALNQIFQRADLLIKRGAIDDAYKWYNQATSRFPENVIAWRTIGDFEFKYLENDEKGRESFDKAIMLDPKDPVTYRNYAYWEHDRGAKYGRKKNYKRAIELNEKALTFLSDESEVRLTKDHIASSFMKLGYLHKDEAYRTRNKTLFKDAEQYFKKVIEILESNLIHKPVEYRDIHHNIIDCTMLTTACLAMGSQKEGNRKYYDLMALKYLITGLKLERDNYQLVYICGHPGIKRILQEYKIPDVNINQKVIPHILKLEQQIEKELDSLPEL